MCDRWNLKLTEAEDLGLVEYDQGMDERAVLRIVDARANEIFRKGEAKALVEAKELAWTPALERAYYASEREPPVAEKPAQPGGDVLKPVAEKARQILASGEVKTEVEAKELAWTRLPHLEQKYNEHLDRAARGLTADDSQ